MTKLARWITAKIIFVGSIALIDHTVRHLPDMDMSQTIFILIGVSMIVLLMLLAVVIIRVS